MANDVDVAWGNRSTGGEVLFKLVLAGRGRGVLNPAHEVVVAVERDGGTSGVVDLEESVITAALPVLGDVEPTPVAYYAT